jgi:hypothetical protein
MTILVLGPSGWLPRKRPKIPDLVRAALPGSWQALPTRELTPLDVRVALAHLLTLHEVPAIVMEAEETMFPRNLTAKFHELVIKHWVTDYYLYWPYGAARSGMDVEIGFLLEQMAGDTPKLESDRITVFYEDDGEKRRSAEIGFGGGGRLEFTPLERTRRTRYHTDLVDLGAIARPWKNYPELFERVLARAGIVE